MTIFKKLQKKSSKVSRAYYVDTKLYEKLSYLSKNVYDASINKLVTACIENIIDTENVKPYPAEYKIDYLNRTYILEQSLVFSLERLSKKYDIAIYKVVNIAIYNSLNDEGIKL